MSKTDKTKPTKFQIAEGTPWRSVTFPHRRTKKHDLRAYWKKVRTQERCAIKRGKQPESALPRNSVLWEQD